jgi:hypothetical protein
VAERDFPRWRVLRIRPVAEGFERQVLEGFRQGGLWPAEAEIVAYELWDVDIDARERSPWLAPRDERIEVGTVVEEDMSTGGGSAGTSDGVTPNVMARGRLTPM